MTPTPPTPATKDMLGRKALTGVDQAQRLLLDHLRCNAAAETLALEDCLDRITAADIFAPEDLPGHPRSTMDGFAVIAADTFGASESMPGYLAIEGEIPMGEMPRQMIQRGQCLRIATGGLLPEGADSVVMFEQTVPVDESLIEVVKGVGKGENVIGKGDDIKEGQCALRSGHRLRPQDLGLLAGLGITEVTVREKPRLGILATGDEIVPHDSAAPPGKIRNINSMTIAGLARRLGAIVQDYGIVADNREFFFQALQEAVAANDLVIFSGGSSVGTRDLGEEAIDSLGSPGILIHGVALKPGKPILIGLHDQTPLFGLPGHPVSAMVCFDLFVAPALDKLAGLEQTTRPAPFVDAVLNRNVASAPGRRDIIRVRLEHDAFTLTAHPVLGKSGAISTLSRAHGYFVIAEDQQGVAEQSQIKVYLYI